MLWLTRPKSLMANTAAALFKRLKNPPDGGFFILAIGRSSRRPMSYQPILNAALLAL